MFSSTTSQIKIGSLIIILAILNILILKYISDVNLIEMFTLIDMFICTDLNLSWTYSRLLLVRMHLHMCHQTHVDS